MCATCTGDVRYAYVLAYGLAVHKLFYVRFLALLSASKAHRRKLLGCVRQLLGCVRIMNVNAFAFYMFASLVHVLALPPVSRATHMPVVSRAVSSRAARPPLVSGKTSAAVGADLQNMNQVSRRVLLRCALWASGMYYGSGTISRASAWTVDQVKPDEKETYAVAQNGSPGALRVLWVGPGNLKGVYQNLFLAGNEVVALDLVRPDADDLSAATAYATEHGVQLRFEQGDATNLKFGDGKFDAVVCSMFLCQDFDPVVVVSEIRRVLKPGGRFGFYEHVEDIDKVVVGKVFGERSVIRVEAKPERTNVMAGVVRKV